MHNSLYHLSYRRVADLLSRYTVGKIPKAFKHIPSMQNWEEVLYLTEPQKWSPNALFQATRIFASNFGAKKAERFYKLVLLPRVRDDIKKNQRLHFALYQTLKKSLYKPAAFFKGILFPLCEVHNHILVVFHFYVPNWSLVNILLGSVCDILLIHQLMIKTLLFHCNTYLNFEHVNKVGHLSDVNKFVYLGVVKLMWMSHIF